MKNINDLPDLCLRTIFSKLPLRDLLRLDQVCPAWKCIQQSVCLARKELTILIGDEPDKLLENSPFIIPYYDELLDSNQNASKLFASSKDQQNQLEFDWLDCKSVKLLTRLLPNIVTVCLAIRCVPPAICIGDMSWGIKTILIDQVIVLLRAWSLSLQTLKIFIDFDGCEDSQIKDDLKMLLSTISISCHSLRLFRFKLENQIYFPIIRTLDLSILSRLEELCLEYHQDLSVVNYSLDKYAKDAPHLRVLAIDSWELQLTFESGAILQYDKKLAKKFTHLPEFEFYNANSLLRSYCARFWRLEKLKIRIDFNVSKIYKFIKLMRPLKNLIYLDINFQMNIEFDENGWRNVSAAAEEEEHEIVNFETIPQLPSVKIIKISASICSHDQLDSIQWDRMFPNLEILHYKDDCVDCTICEPKTENYNQSEEWEDWKDYEPNSWMKPDKCLKFALQPWKHCAKMHSVYTGDYRYPYKISLDELYDRV